MSKAKFFNYKATSKVACAWCNRDKLMICDDWRYIALAKPEI